MRTNIQPENILLLLPHIHSHICRPFQLFVCPECKSPHAGSHMSSLHGEGMKDGNPGLNKGKHTQAEVSAAVTSTTAIAAILHISDTGEFDPLAPALLQDQRLSKSSDFSNFFFPSCNRSILVVLASRSAVQIATHLGRHLCSFLVRGLSWCFH